MENKKKNKIDGNIRLTIPLNQTEELSALERIINESKKPNNNIEIVNNNIEKRKRKPKHQTEEARLEAIRASKRKYAKKNYKSKKKPVEGEGLTENIIKHFEKDNNEMKQLSKSFKEHLKTEKITGGKLNQKHLKYYESYSDSSSDYDDDSIVQSLIFDKNKFTIPECKKWLKKNNYKIYKVD